MPNPRVPRPDSGEFWRALGFYHEPDPSARCWRFVGPASGLATLARMLASQADKADREGKAVALAVGPYDDLHIRVWERAGIDDESIYGPAADLRRLSQLLQTRLASAKVGAEFVIAYEYAPDVEYRLVFEVKDEEFDLATALPAVIEPEPEEIVKHENASGAVLVPPLAFEFHEDDEGFLWEAEGTISIEGDAVVIEHQTKDAFFGTYKSEVKRTAVPLDAISWVKFKRKMFSAELSIQAQTMRILEDIPTSKRGRIRLTFERDLRDEAEHLADVLQNMLEGES